MVSADASAALSHAPVRTRRAIPTALHVRRALPGLDRLAAADVARVVGTLVRVYHPERVFAFGSHARGTATRNSDLDLLIVLSDRVEYPHRLAQDALAKIGAHAVPIDLVFMAARDFAWRSASPASLPSTVLREGRELYAA